MKSFENMRDRILYCDLTCEEIFCLGASGFHGYIRQTLTIEMVSFEHNKRDMFPSLFIGNHWTNK